MELLTSSGFANIPEVEIVAYGSLDEVHLAKAKRHYSKFTQTQKYVCITI
jgi:hypothetical protein